MYKLPRISKDDYLKEESERSRHTTVHLPKVISSERCPLYNATSDAFEYSQMTWKFVKEYEPIRISLSNQSK